MQQSFLVYAGSSLMGVIGLLAGVGSHDVVTSFRTPPPPISMKLKKLEFVDGNFVQSFSIKGEGASSADWAAKITRKDRILCSGGGTSVYTNDVETRLSPSEWTDDECPDLAPGDVAHAVWMYRSTDGYFTPLTASIGITETNLPPS